jgi:hypothetical protein
MVFSVLSSCTARPLSAQFARIPTTIRHLSSGTETTNLKPADTIPHVRKIRALYDEETITVYQAHSPEIAIGAVEMQKLNASPQLKPERMIWMKPSWGWMM